MKPAGSKVKKSYNSRLKKIDDKGLCGDPEVVDSPKEFDRKVALVTRLLNESSHAIAFTGAGISTSSGIADFRGPRGVWTREQNGEAVVEQDDTAELFEKAEPTVSHMALKKLIDVGRIKHVISQNVDGLHLRSGIDVNDISELHGNIFIEKCDKCRTEFFRKYDVGGMGLQLTGNRCERPDCGGPLRDFAIDWDTALPKDKFKRAHAEMDKADLVLCLGTSLRITPAGNMPLRALKPKRARNWKSGKLIIVNLQATHLDKKATLKLNHYCDRVMQEMCRQMGVTIPRYSKTLTPGNSLQGFDSNDEYFVECGNSCLHQSTKDQSAIQATNTTSIVNTQRSIYENVHEARGDDKVATKRKATTSVVSGSGVGVAVASVGSELQASRVRAGDTCAPDLDEFAASTSSSPFHTTDCEDAVVDHCGVGAESGKKKKPKTARI